MATLTVRGLADELHRRLRVRAAQNGRSMEAEVRSILEEHLRAPARVGGGLGTRIHARFAAIDSDGVEFPRRQDPPRAAVFDE